MIDSESPYMTSEGFFLFLLGRIAFGSYKDG